MNWLLGGLTVVALGGLAAWVMLGAIRRTARRQQTGLPALPECPGASPAGPVSPAAGDRAVLEAAGARYLGTTYAPSTVRRFSGRGLLGRAVVDLVLDPAGLRVDRGAAGAWCIPAEAVRGAEVATHHAGKAVYAPRVLVVDWLLGGTGLRSGFVLDEPAAGEWASRLDALVAR